MSEQRPGDPGNTHLSRRTVLRMMGGASAAALHVGDRQGVDAAQTVAADPNAISIPDSGANLPTDEVTFRFVDSGDNQAIFFQQFFPAYEEAHPNITVQYDPLPWNEIAQIVPIGVQNGNAHDVFQLPLTITGAQAVREGWVTPLDDIVPNFAEWKAAFPPAAFVQGINMFDGKAYGLPHNSNQRYITLLLYNVDYMAEAGYDPATAPLTWDEYRDAARKITEQGQGQYYGMIIGGNQIAQWSNLIGNLVQVAGTPTTPGGPGPNGYFNWQTGTSDYTDDAWLGAIDLLLGMNADGSVFPGSLGINAPQARAMMPQGAAGTILQGPWNIPLWQKEHPGFNFGVAGMPVPSAGATPFPLHYLPGGSNQRWVYAQSPHMQIAADIIHYLGTEEGQTDWARIVGIGDPPIFRSALERIDLDPRAATAARLAQEQMRLAPEPLVRNPEVAQVLLELQPVTPNLAETIQGIFTGQLGDTRLPLQELTDRTDAELDRAIGAAQAKGAQVSREDWVFPNWDPTRDYTEADYAAL